MSRSTARARNHTRFGVVQVQEEARLPRDLVQEVSDLFQDAVADSQYRQPLLPATVVKALDAANSPQSSMRQIAKIIRVDPGLAAEVLRTANSGFYGGSQYVATLHQALARVGVSGLRELLLVSCGGRVLKVAGDKEFGERLRKRSMAVAFASKIVAQHAGGDAEQAFTAGLLHDVGLAAFHSLYSKVQRGTPKLKRNDIAMRDALARELHEEVGAGLALNWGLPGPVIGAMGYHHKPSKAITGIRMATIVSAARAIVANDAGLTDPVEPDIEMGAVDALGLSPNAQTRMRDDVLRLFQRAAGK